jgi:acetyltransferase-like isoleucine patch superfamily enzyme
MKRFIGKLDRELTKFFLVIKHPRMSGRIGRNSFIHGSYRIDGEKHIFIGNDCYFQRGLWLYCHGSQEESTKLSIGDGGVFGYNNHFVAIGRIRIEDNVLTANNVFITDGTHNFSNRNVPIKVQGVRRIRDVTIGSGSWIGENVCIIGASIGKNCVIGANSVVTMDIPDFSVAVGAPARVVKTI